MSNETDFDWGLTSGLPLADAEVEVIEAEFGYNNDIAAGAVFANLTFRTEDGETHEQSFSVGQGWEIGAKGAELNSDNGKPRKLSQRSNYGLLVGSAITAIGGVEKMAQLGKGFRFADTWVGTRWRTATVEVEVTKGGVKDGEKIKRDRIVFVEFLGKGDAAPATTTKAAAKADTPAVDPELWDKLVAIAKDAKDHDAFMDLALELDGVQGVKAVEKLVMSTKAGSVWAAAQA